MPLCNQTSRKSRQNPHIYLKLLTSAYSADIHLPKRAKSRLAHIKDASLQSNQSEITTKPPHLSQTAYLRLLSEHTSPETSKIQTRTYKRCLSAIKPVGNHDKTPTFISNCLPPLTQRTYISRNEQNPDSHI